MKLKWIKLPSNFYFTPKMRLLGRGERGREYQLIYVFMLCLSGSLGFGGRLMLAEDEPYDAESLSVIFDTDLELVKEALARMLELHIISMSDTELRLLEWEDTQFITADPEDEYDVDAESEEEIAPPRAKKKTQSSKERVRRFREKRKNSNPAVDVTQDVTNVTQDVTNVTLDVTPDVTLDVTPDSVTSLKYLSKEENKNKNNNNNITCVMKEEKEREKENEASLTRASSEDISLSLDDEERSVDNEEFSVMELGELGNVRLKKSEYEAFIEEFPEDYSERIDELSLYMASSGREYKDHYATLKVFSKKRFSRDSGSSSLLAKGEPYHSSFIAHHSSFPHHQMGVLPATAGVPHSSLIAPRSSFILHRGGSFDPNEAMLDAITRAMEDSDEEES